MNPIFLPAYSPELNPAERIFKGIRRHIEDIVYPALQSKQHRIEYFLWRLRADKQWVRQPISWDWIHNGFNQLPSADTRLTYT